ncbi:SHOCT domain-containing protein [Oenococcus oeni]
MPKFDSKFSKDLFENTKKLAKNTVNKAVDYEKEKSKQRKSTIKINDLIFNDENQELTIKRMMKNMVCDYSAIINYKPIVNGGTIKKHHGITRAVVGGALTGGAGAIVGAVTGGKKFSAVNKLAIQIFFENNKDYQELFINKKMKTDSSQYKKIQEDFNRLSSKLDMIISTNSTADIKSPSSSNDPDDLIKFKSLLDQGMITQEEFEAKKKEILGL